MDVQPLSSEELSLFSDRIARSLREQPLDLKPEVHRERVAEVLRQVGDATWYQLLGIRPADSDLDIHAAYERLGRLVHPQHAERVGLAGKESVLEMLFERATRAYLTLSDPERRKSYDWEVGSDPGAVPAPVDRPAENRDIARDYYRRACDMVEEEQFHFAIELLKEAVRREPKPEYHALLGRLLARNSHPRWLRAAAENLEAAIRRGGKGDRGLEAALEEVRERLANPEPEKPEDDEEDLDFRALDPDTGGKPYKPKKR
ncbi:MAG TPA: DnaJ domain-containing protein [Thermoanaerobaculia bacterium]|nr:DnaJ domain-containing protein [Thermoanaerobaculia bacterium]